MKLSLGENIKELRKEKGLTQEELVSCLLLGNVKFRRADFETSDSRPLCEIMRDKWLKAKDFDLVRELEEFKEIEEKLRI